MRKIRCLTVLAALAAPLIAASAATADPISYVTTGSFAPGGTVATSNGFTITYTPATNTAAMNGGNVNLGSFLLSGSSALGAGDFSSVAFTLNINQLTPIGSASGSANFTGTVDTASNVLLLAFTPNPITIQGPGISYNYFVNNQTNPLYGSTPFAAALTLNARSTLSGTLSETVTPLPKSAMAGSALLGLTALGMVRRRNKVAPAAV